jgi:Phosphoribosylformimino-5-aminoimidazole carboxamide ribonucleotide (ProFAR) isomerase
VIAIPAVDLREGSCVQLVGGSYATEKVRLDDPAAVARNWEEQGFRQLHLVDLDAATGRGSNADVIRTILAASGAHVHVGGGIRTSDQVLQLLGAGAARVVVGTRAYEDHAWLAEIATVSPGSIVVAADVRDRWIMTHGWTRTQNRTILSWIDDLNELPLGGILVTAVHMEGKLQGTDLALMEDAVEESAFPVYASGGISGMSDLRALAERGVAAAIIGMALYTGAVDPRAVAEEFAQ